MNNELNTIELVDTTIDVTQKLTNEIINQYQQEIEHLQLVTSELLKILTNVISHGSFDRDYLIQLRDKLTQIKNDFTLILTGQKTITPDNIVQSPGQLDLDKISTIDEKLSKILKL